MASVSKILFTAPFHHLESSLASRVRGMGCGDPLAHRRVVVISSRLRDHVQSVLARASSFAGVEVLGMIDLARKIAEPERSLAELRRIHPALAETLAKEVFECTRGEFAFYPSDSVGYGENLYATLTDLAEANFSPHDLRKLSQEIPGPDAARLWDLGVLIERYRNCMRERGFYDLSSLFLTACERAEADPPRVPTIFYGFAEMNAIQRRLAAAVCREAQSQALVPAQTDAPACAYALPFIHWLEEQGFQREQAGPIASRPLSGLAEAIFSRHGAQAGPLAADAMRVVAAPTRGREVREACREMLRAREDFESEDEVCVLMTEQGGYQDLFEETFQTLEIPCLTKGRNPLSETSAARLFLLMLRLPVEGYPRAELMRFLGEGGFIGTPRFRYLAEKYGFEELVCDDILVSRWEFFSRSLPYLRGADAWCAELDDALERMKEGDEERPAAYSLAISMSEVVDLMERIPEAGSLSLFVQSALEVFSETTCDLVDAKAVKDVVRLLADLDAVTGEMTREAFYDLCELFFEKTPQSVNKLEERHLASLSSIQSARGISFDTVVLAGMGEGLFPAQGSENPLLPDSTREVLNRVAKQRFPEREMALPLKKYRDNEARFQLWTILQSVRKRLVITVTSVEDGTGNETASFPSLYLHYLADALGEARDGAWGLFAGLRSNTATTTPNVGACSGNPVQLREYDLARMVEQIRRSEAGALAYMNDFPGFLRKRNALAERWRQGALTAFDGMLTTPDLLQIIRERIHSPAWPLGVTAVEVFFGCPYRFVNERLYPRMEKREEPLPPFVLDGRRRGQLTHRALEHFHLWLKRENRSIDALDETTAQGALLDAIHEALREEADAAESPPLLALPWAVLENTLYRRLEGYLEQTRAEQTGRQPVSVEERFGGRGSEPLRITLQAGELALSGRMDLLEENEAGEYRVIDFKTWGRKNSLPAKGKILDGGASLQLHLYARHLRARTDALPESARVSGAYVYLTEEEGAEERVRSSEDIEGRMADVDALLDYFLASSGKGRFFPTPSDVGCRYCNYRMVCGPDRIERAARKEGAPEINELLVLRERAV